MNILVKFGWTEFVIRNALTKLVDELMAMKPVKYEYEIGKHVLQSKEDPIEIKVISDEDIITAAKAETLRGLKDAEGLLKK